MCIKVHQFLYVYRPEKECCKLTETRQLWRRPGRGPEILKFVLKCPEIGVRSCNLYIYPEIFMCFHNFLKTHHFTYFTYE